MNRTLQARITPMLVAVLALLGSGCDTGSSPVAPVDAKGGSGEHAASVVGSDGDRDDHGEGGLVRLDDVAAARLGLEVAEAGPGVLEVTVELPGEVRVNGDRMAHVGPRVGGVVRRVLVSLGDTVREGQLLAVLESRGLADAKAAYLAAGERLRLAEATHRREERLWREKVSAEQDYLDATSALAEARIALRTAEKTLHVLGFGEQEVGRLAEEPDTEYASYRLTAPFDGEVIDRHITVGETIPAEATVFTVADLATVWVDLRVYQKDLSRVRAGQAARVEPAEDGFEETAIVGLVQPLLGVATRTALARITMQNPDRRWKPGMFVTARVVVDTGRVAVRVPDTAVIRMGDGDPVVFVETASGFAPRPVVLGRRTDEHVEVTAGLEPGERYVASGAFSLKAELAKGSPGDGHGH